MTDKRVGASDQLFKKLVGDNYGAEPTYGAVVINLEAEHERVHAGQTFQSWVYTGTVANDSTIDLAIITTGTANPVHFTWKIAAGGDAIGFLYEGITGTFSSAAPKFNMNRASAEVSPIVAYQYPTVTVLGVLLNEEFLPGGSGGTAEGGTARMHTEWILAAGKRYLIRLQNVAGTAQEGNITVQWYQLR